NLEAGLRKNKYLLKQDPSTESNIEIIDPIFEKFIDEPALDYSPPSGDDKDDDDDLFDLKSDNDKWKKLFYEMRTRSITYLAGIAEDVFVQVGKFTFLADFIVIDYEINPRVPLILRRPFLRTARALVDQDPSTESNIEIIDPIFEKFIDEPALDYSPPSGDDNDDDDDLFDLKSDNDEWKKLFYGDF
nr:reverse transcriptase domain-containing protein [Tanacetum cinerariifolium]